MGLGYRSGVGEVIFAMVKAWPDVAHASTRLSQHNNRLHRMHFAGLRHTLKYIFVLHQDGGNMLIGPLILGSYWDP